MENSEKKEVIGLLEKEIVELNTLYKELLKESNKFNDLKDIRMKLKELEICLNDIKIK